MHRPIQRKCQTAFLNGVRQSDPIRKIRSKWAQWIYARLANYARVNHPDVMQNRVQSQPWLLKAMGNPIVMGALGLVAAKMIHRR